MTLDEAIMHANEVAKEKENEAQDLEYSKLDWRHEANQCSECAKEHHQLAKWLMELKQLRERQSDINKIRVEIDQTEINGHIRDVECFRAGINVALNVIDKYRAESEES